MLKPKINDVIKLDKEKHQAVISSAEKLKTAKCAFHESADMMRKTDETFWKNVFITFPELKGFEVSFNHNKNELKITSSEENE